jgi:phosphopantetheine adenylyltransferase
MGSGSTLTCLHGGHQAVIAMATACALAVALTSGPSLAQSNPRPRTVNPTQSTVLSAEK